MTNDVPPEARARILQLNFVAWGDTHERVSITRFIIPASFPILACISYTAPSPVTRYTAEAPKDQPESLSCAVDTKNYAVSPWNRWDQTKPEYKDLVAAACECQWTIHERNSAREDLDNAGRGLAITGMILSGLAAGATTALSVSVATTSNPTDIQKGFTAGTASLTAIGGILAGVGGLLPSVEKQNTDTALAWALWTRGKNELLKWDLTTDDKERKKIIADATALFNECGGDAQVLSSPTSHRQPANEGVAMQPLPAVIIPYPLDARSPVGQSPPPPVLVF